jgi:D-alanyl-D-alanine carboxypeptidase
MTPSTGADQETSGRLVATMWWGSHSGRCRIVALGTLVALLLSAPAGSAASAHGRSRPRAAALTAAIVRVMRQAAIPGAIVGVWQRGYTPYIRAFGVRDKATRQPMATKLYMRIGSETKTFVGTALLQLVGRGNVDLDSPISSYLAGVPDGHAITIRDLADMHSGLLNYTNNPAFVHAWFAAPRRPWTPRQLLAYSFSKPVMFWPGTRYDYSNTNTVLLGRVIEKVSHEPLAAYIDRHILKPLHLFHTSFPTVTEFPAPHAQGYTNNTVKCLESGGRACRKVVNATNWSPSWGWAAAAMISTLGDLHRWARDVATGELLTPASQRQRLRFKPTGVRRVGYGLALNDSNGWIGHNGGVPGYQSLTIYLCAEGATVVALINTNINPPDARTPLVNRLGQSITRIITPNRVYVPW